MRLLEFAFNLIYYQVLRSDGFDRGDASFLGMGWTVFFTTLIIILGIVVFAFLAIYVRFLLFFFHIYLLIC
jgi:hypothetical protein